MYKAVIKGYVQSVGFRATAKQIADRKGLQGTVRNLADGAVEIILAHSRAELEQLIKEIKNTLPPHCITTFAIEEHSSSSLPPGFTIIR